MPNQPQAVTANLSASRERVGPDNTHDDPTNTARLAIEPGDPMRRVCNTNPTGTVRFTPTT
jgi:hypothetical protein